MAKPCEWDLFGLGVEGLVRNKKRGQWPRGCLERARTPGLTVGSRWSYHLGGPHTSLVGLCLCFLIRQMKTEPRHRSGRFSPIGETPRTMQGRVLFFSHYISSSLMANPTQQPKRDTEARTLEKTPATRWGKVSIPFLAKHSFAAGKQSEPRSECVWPRLLCFITN